MGRIHRYATVLAVVLGCAFAQQYPFLRVPGSPKNPQALFQDSKGRLWIAGSELACFDGRRFPPLRDYGFPAVGALDVAEDPSGAIWIGAETGVYRFAGGRVEELAKGVAISVIAASSDTVAAAISPLGQSLFKDADLVRIQRNGATWKTEVVESLESPGPLILDPSGNLLYPWTTKGWGEIRFDDLARWKPGTTLPIRHRGAQGDPTNGR